MNRTATTMLIPALMTAVLAGCGDGTEAKAKTISCTLTQSSFKTCTELTADEATADQNKATCQGTAVDGACSRDGAVGVCNFADPKGSGVTASTVYYSPVTPENAKKGCTDSGGTPS